MSRNVPIVEYLLTDLQTKHNGGNLDFRQAKGQKTNKAKPFKENMSVPHTVLATGWVPFCIIFLVRNFEVFLIAFVSEDY